MAKTNLFDKAKRQRLATAHEWSRRKLQPFREKYVEFKKQYVGHNYGENGAMERVPVNFIQLAVDTFRRRLVSSNPQVNITTNVKDYKPKAYEFQVAVNHVLREMDFESTVNRWVTEALFQLGVMKIGLTSSGEAEQDGYLHDSGQPYADIVYLDDWVHDMMASRYEEAQYSGNRYYREADFILNSDLYDTSGREKEISGYVRKLTNEGGDSKGQTLAIGEDREVDVQYEPTVALWDIWIPRENVLVTMLADEDGGLRQSAPLRVVEWDGPEMGPFHILSYNDSGSVMPVSPVSTMMDLHDLANRIYRKIARQAERQKQIGIFGGGASDDAQRIKDSDDGDFIRADNPDKTREARFGGFDQQNLALFLQTKDLFFTMPGGNLDALAGLSPQSDTLGQDQLLAVNANTKIQEMGDRTMNAVSKAAESIGDYIWYDPNANFEIEDDIRGTNISRIVKFNDGIKEGDFLDYNITLEPYSLNKQSPEQRLQTLLNTFERLVVPLMPILEAQGKAPDIDFLIDIVARYANMPEVRDMMGVLSPEDMARLEARSGGKEARQSPVTTRTNVRKNIPGASRSGKDDVLSRVLSGGGVQGSESAALRRPTG